MPRIMCTQKLWRALGNSGQPPVGPAETSVPGAVLGSWALRSFHYNRKGLVLALEERTYLTLVVSLAPRDGFRRRFAEALGNGLTDLGVPAAHIDLEVMVVDCLPLARLNDRSMAGALNQLEFLAHCELDYVSDLRRVQRNLNEVPHVNRDPCVPLEAVAQLFGSAPPSSRWRVH